MNPNQQSQFRFDSKMIAKRTGKVIKDKHKTSFDNYYDLESAEFNPETVQLMRNLNKNSTNILGNIGETDSELSDQNRRNNIWKLFQKFHNNKQQLQDPKESLLACLDQSLQPDLQMNAPPEILHVQQVVSEPTKKQKNHQYKRKTGLENFTSNHCKEDQQLDIDYQNSIPTSFTVQKLAYNIESSNSRYPTRLRLKPLHYWQGQKPIYRNQKCIGIMRKRE